MATSSVVPFSEDDYNRPVVLASVPLLLKFVKYEQHYPDFPKNLSAIVEMALKPHPPMKGQEYKAGFIAMTALSSLCVLARLWTRKYYHKAGLWWDDYLAVVAMIFAWVWTVIAVLSFTMGGVGMHVWSASFHTLSNGLKFEVFDQITYNFAAIFTKLSILFFILRITPPTSAIMYRTVVATMAVFTINFVVQNVMILTACKPAKASWDLGMRFERFECLNWWHLVIGQSISWSLTDIWNLILPIPLVWDLRAPLRQKIGMIILFGFGGVAVAASIVKIAYLKGVYNSWDPTWNAIPVLFWFHAEVCIGLITASLPGLSVFLMRLIPVFTRSKVRFVTESTHISYKSKDEKTIEERPTRKKLASTIDSKDLYTEQKNMVEDRPFEHPNLGRDRNNKILSLVPQGGTARITTAIAALNPEPEPDMELFLHYPANAVSQKGPVPALRTTRDLEPGPGVVEGGPTERPWTAGASLDGEREYEDDFRSLPSLRFVDNGENGNSRRFSQNSSGGGSDGQRPQRYHIPSYGENHEQRQGGTGVSETDHGHASNEGMTDLRANASAYDDSDESSVDLIIQRPGSASAQ